ncbi:MAG TPA: ROK family protein [Longimicrobiales bacterium]|nr:ROK family protein [Longimicrobiales bacterium]
MSGPSTNGRWVVGVDIGGTNTVVGLVPWEGGPPVALCSRPTEPRRGADAVVADVADMAEAVTAEALERLGATRDRIVGVGIGCPGPLDLERGIVVTTPNLGWSGYPIRDRVGEALGLPATLDNDANCATYGEWWQGAARGARQVAGVTLGTGIGGGLIIDGKLLRGASGMAGEFGHTTIDLGGRRCGCGNRGCVEAYASGPNIAARAREGIEAGRTSRLLDLVGGDPERLTAQTVYDGLLLGDPLARDVMIEAATMLGVGVANLVNLLNPEVVVIVGGVTRAGEHLFRPLREEVRRRAFSVGVEACRVVPGELEGTAGVIGAAGVFVMEQEGAA